MTHKLLNSALTRIAAVATLTIAAALPDAVSAATTTGYEAWGDNAGVVLWRAVSGTETLFHSSTIIDVASDGTLGTAYAMDSNSGTTSWQKFASNQTAYSAPGRVLVYDAAGYTANSDAQFAPLSFGGMWVKVLQAEGVPYCITDNKTDGTDRKVELGASGYSTLFKFDASFTFNRNSAVNVLGTATVDIASGATFTINARANKGATVASGNALVLKGAGELSVNGGLSVAGTLNISASTYPSIAGDVTLAGDSTIVLPSGTAIGSAVDISVCSGTLSVGGPVNVQIGSGDPVSASLTVSNGKITLIETTSTYTATISGDTAFSAIQWQKDGASATISSMGSAMLEISGSGTISGLDTTPLGITIADGVTLDATSVPNFSGVETSGLGTFLFTANYPQTVPAGVKYAYTGGTDENNVVTIAGVVVNGTLKTTGHVNFTGFAINNGGTLDVVDGKTTATATTYGGYGDKQILGNIIVRAGATFAPTQTDFLDWAGATSQTIDIYGTLAMGNTRWSIKVATACAVNLYPGARVTGTGDSNGVFDLINAGSKLNAYPGENGGEIVIEGIVKTRNANTPIWVAADTTLKIGGLRGGGVNKSGDGTLEISGTIDSPAASTVSEGTFAFVDTTVAVPITVNAGKTLMATASSDVTVPLNATANASANVTVSGDGVVNGTIAFGGKPTGTLAGLSSSTWQGTVAIPSLSAPANLSILTSCGNGDSVISLAGITGSSYIMASGSRTYNVGGVSIDGDVQFDNGSSGSTVNFAKLSGTADLKIVAWAGCSSATYNFNTVEDFTGTLVVNNAITRGGGGTFNVGIGNIVDSSAALGKCLLAIENQSIENPTGEVVYNYSNLQLNGASTNLFYTTVNGQSGIYIAAAKIGDDSYVSIDAAMTAAKNGGQSIRSIQVLDTSAVPQGYAVIDGKLVKKEFFIILK